MINRRSLDIITAATSARRSKRGSDLEHADTHISLPASTKLIHSLTYYRASHKSTACTEAHPPTSLSLWLLSCGICQDAAARLGTPHPRLGYSLICHQTSTTATAVALKVRCMPIGKFMLIAERSSKKVMLTLAYCSNTSLLRYICRPIHPNHCPSENSADASSSCRNRSIHARIPHRRRHNIRQKTDTWRGKI